MNKILSFLLLLYSLGAHSQTAHLDSLQQALRKEGNDTKRIAILNDLSLSYFNYKLDEAQESTAEALALAEKIKDEKEEAWALTYRGYYYYGVGELSLAKKHYLSALSLARRLKLNDLETQVSLLLGDILLVSTAYDSALQFYKQAEEQSRTDNPIWQVVAHVGLSRYHIRRGEFDNALTYAEQATKLSQDVPASTQALAWLQRGTVLVELSRLTEAEQALDKVSQLGARYPNTLALCNFERARILHARGKFEESLGVYSQVLSHHRSVGTRYYLAEINEKMGDVLQENGYHELALQHLQEAVRLAETHGFKMLLASSYYDLAWAFYRIRSYDLSHNYINKAIQGYESIGLVTQKYWCYNLAGNLAARRGQYDSAYRYLQQSLQSSTRVGKPYYLSANYFNLGDLFLDQQKYEQALPNYWKGLKIDLQIGDEYGQCLYYDRIGRLYTATGQYDSAKLYLEKAIAQAVPTSGTDIFRTAYIDMANLLHKTGQSEKAVEYYQKYNLFSDSLFSKQRAQSQAAYQALYNLEKREKEIELLNKSNQLSQSQLRQQRIILYVSLASTLAFLFVGIFYYRFAQRLRSLNQTISEKNEEIQAQSEELVEANNSLTELNRAINEQKDKIEEQTKELQQSYSYISNINQELETRIEVRTAELREAYKELDTFFYRSSHDFRRPLTTFMGLAEVAKVVVKDPVALELFAKVDENARTLDRMLHKLQSISDLGAQELVYKEILLQEIITLTLESFQASIAAKKIQVNTHIKTSHTLYTYPALLKIIIQNLLENAIIFCSDINPSLDIRAYEQQGKLILEFSDNGQGIEDEYQSKIFDMYFRANEFSKGNGLGLYIVKKAVQKLQGQVSLQSTVHQGTTVKVTLPIRVYASE